MRTTRLWTLTPSARRKTLASAPAATRAAVSRALARSSTLRTSVWSNLRTPARSAWPGRGRCTSSTSASTGHGLMRSAQFAWSRFSIRSATGLPSVRPWRIPAQTVARSDSIFIRPPRPWPSWRRARSRVDVLRGHLEARGQALDDRHQAGAVGLAGGRETQRCHPDKATSRPRATGASPVARRSGGWALRSRWLRRAPQSRGRGPGGHAPHGGRHGARRGSRRSSSRSCCCPCCPGPPSLRR